MKMTQSSLIGLVIALIQMTAYSQKQTQLLDAALCTIVVPDKTIRVVPWDSVSNTFKTNSARVLSWEDSTQLVADKSTLTMAQLVAGQPLSEEVKTRTVLPGVEGDCFFVRKGVKTLTDLHGERGSLLIEKADGKEVVRRVLILLLFKGELMKRNLMIGPNDAFYAIMAPEVPCCERKVGEAKPAPKSTGSNTEDAAVVRRLMERRQIAAPATVIPAAGPAQGLRVVDKSGKTHEMKEVAINYDPGKFAYSYADLGNTKVSDGIRVVQGEVTLLVEWARIRSLDLASGTNAQLVLTNGSKHEVELARFSDALMRWKTDLGQAELRLDKIKSKHSVISNCRFD